MTATWIVAVSLSVQGWYAAKPVQPTPNLLSSFTTELARDEWQRNGNIRLAGAKLKNVYMPPGAVFSFNRLVGPRVEGQGYTDAPTYTGFGKMDALAGGLCQLSSTIYNAALLANLRIIERHQHSLTVRYLQPGRDATISEYSDLKFTNPNPFPIRVVLEVKGRRLECSVYGAKPLLTETQIDVEENRLRDGRIATRTIRTIFRDGLPIRREVVSEDVYKPSQ
jgi:vancomycin resistance protein YoaR